MIIMPNITNSSISDNIPPPNPSGSYVTNMMNPCCSFNGCDSELHEDGEHCYRFKMCGHGCCVPCYLESDNISTCDLCKLPTDHIFRETIEDFTKSLRPFMTGLQKQLKRTLDDNAELQDICEKRLKLAKDLEEEKRMQLEDMKKTEDIHQTEKEKLQNDVAALKKSLEEAKKRELGETIDPHCTECGYTVAFERSRICVPCGYNNLILKYIKSEGEENQDSGNIRIVSYEKAECSLLCGNCVLDRHHDHETIIYFQLKLNQQSAIHEKETMDRLDAAFDDKWKSLCNTTNQSHMKIIEALKSVKELAKGKDTWEEYRKLSTRFAYIVQRTVEARKRMGGQMIQFHVDMQNILNEVLALNSENRQDSNPGHSVGV